MSDKSDMTSLKWCAVAIVAAAAIVSAAAIVCAKTLKRPVPVASQRFDIRTFTRRVANGDDVGFIMLIDKQSGTTYKLNNNRWQKLETE